RLPASDLHQAGRGPADRLLRDHPAPRLAGLRARQFQGAVRSDRTRARSSRDTVEVIPISRGKVAKQAHVGLPDGTFEEEHGRESFNGRASHLYRTHPPTAWVKVDGPLRPRAFEVGHVKAADGTDASAGWTLLAGKAGAARAVRSRSPGDTGAGPARREGRVRGSGEARRGVHAARVPASSAGCGWLAGRLVPGAAERARLPADRIAALSPAAERPLHVG